MATFASARYPHLTLQDADGIWAQFVDGRFQTDDDQVADRLRGLPKAERITEVDDELPEEEEDTDAKEPLAKAPAKPAAKKATAPKTPPAPKE